MFRYVLAATAALTISCNASAQLVNGGFEAPVVTDSCCITAPPSSIPGWTPSGGNVNVVNGNFGSTGGNLAFQGVQYLDLIGEGSTGSISQTFATITGQAYTLSFAYAHNLFGGTPSASALFSVDGLAGLLFHNTGSTSNLDWLTFSGSFVADDASATLNFTNVTGGNNAGVLLDAVSVQAAVPEPGTWALMLLGFGMVGGATRMARRQRRMAVLAAV